MFSYQILQSEYMMEQILLSSFCTPIRIESLFFFIINLLKYTIYIVNFTMKWIKILKIVNIYALSHMYKYFSCFELCFVHEIQNNL